MTALQLHTLLTTHDLHSTSYLAVLEAIERGEQKLNDIRAGLNISDSATIGLLDVLVARGFIIRVNATFDRRRKLSALTDTGRQLLQQFYDLQTRTDIE